MGTLVAALLLAGCGSVSADGGGSGAGPGGDDTLVGRTFLSTAVTVDGEPRPLVRGSQLSMTFDKKTMGVNAGCNHLFASYDAASGSLIEPFGGTEMACAEPLMAQDEWLLDFLVNATYSLDADTLRVTGGSTTIELVDEEVAVPDAALTGTEWVLEGIVSGSDETGAIASVPSGVRSTLRFTADNKLLAELGCNGGGGEVTVADSTLVVREFAQTLMACGGAKDEVERTVVGVLGRDTEIGYVVNGQTLTLRAGPTGLIYHAG